MTYILLECFFYYLQLGQPAYRLRLAAMVVGDNRIAEEAYGSAIRYFLMPLQQLLFNRSLGIDLIALFSVGAVAFRSFTPSQRMLFVVVACYWLWAGYGAMTPWEYQPPSREIRLLFPYILPISHLLPAAIGAVFSRRYKLLVIGTILATHVVCLASGGRWEQSSRISRELLNYAAAHPRTLFLTDINTLNDMYIANKCRLPENVVCVPSLTSDEYLLVNKEPEHSPIHFDTSEVTAFLHNREAERRLHEPELAEYVSTRSVRIIDRRPRILKLIFRPFSRLLPDMTFFVLNDGWEVIELIPQQ